ncbi:hypothetical protein D187_002954 [Cystobacter fuscus DSM 2262]|uniref:Uncharacterized protein n=1 Tax=Cystobacter fuscus (strain ATCC 25194 / DSM 2262 / NBRC 100088 / M29) TaxID=1242864 RepID=S9QDN7_CYSF2|nr:hypothetical protein D187_002954 [Cystobacter fuscus DSM 2262]
MVLHRSVRPRGQAARRVFVQVRAANHENSLLERSDTAHCQFVSDNESCQ